MSFFRTNLGWAAVPVRLALAAVFIAHGSQKLYGAFGGGGIEGFAGGLAGRGLPAAMLLAWLVGLAEFLGGVAVLVGFLTRLGALCIIAVMVGAILIIHGRNGFFLSNGGFEFPLANLGLAFCLLIGGAGAVSIDGAIAGGKPAAEVSPPPAA